MNIQSYEAIKSAFLYKSLLIAFIAMLPLFLKAQEIKVDCTDKPLNGILTGLRDDYGIMVSFDDSRLSIYKLTLNRKFSSPSQAMDFLLKGLPLGYELNNGVYIIFPVIPPAKPKSYIISGNISDITSHELLPYSAIQINGKGFFSDDKGSFSFISSSDSIFAARISHLGFYILDTIVPAGSHYNFRLTPSVIQMQEVIVEGKPVARSIQTGNAPGIIKLNHKIAYYLPGNGDNSVFNLLRLQPGILAAGDQSNDLVIWGSDEGQSQVIFDGFSLYGMKNFNDNISAVNPYMAKDIKVLKGAFGAGYGGKTGAIIDITGIEGDMLSPAFHLTVNNMTVNGLVSVPFRKSSSLVMAYRQTYYDLYNPVAYSSGSGYGRGRLSGSGADYYLVPDYIFRDANIKYSSGGRNNNFFISLYGGGDSFDYGFENEDLRNLSAEYEEKNLQAGASVYFDHKWREKNKTSLTLSYSGLNTDRYYHEVTVESNGYQGGGQGGTFISAEERTTNNIYELHARIENSIVLSERHSINTGAGVLKYRTDNSIQEIGDITSRDYPLLYFYLSDNIAMNNKLTLVPGVRADFNINSGRLFIQPRFSAEYRLRDNLKANFAAGIYNQFLSKNMIIDPSGNYRLLWSLPGSGTDENLNSQIYTGGISFNNNGFTFSLEGYIRHISSISRFTGDADSVNYTLYQGKIRSKGIDIFLKKEFGEHSVWIAYTLGKTIEHFPYFPDEDFAPSMHDQRHELKIAGLAKLRSFHFSASYVFGSGLPDPALLPEVADYTRAYSRLDADIIYSLNIKKVSLDAGISVLNIFNTENIRYSNYTRIPTAESTVISLYSEAVPFTPTLFLKLSF